MIGAITVRERGPAPGLTKRVFARQSKSAWFSAGLFDHVEYSKTPFSEEFRQAAGFPARRGQNLPRGSKGFNRSYYGRKLRSRFGGGVGLALPNVYTGESVRAMGFVRTVATPKGVTNRYRANRLNYKNPHTRVHPIREVQHRLEPQITGTVNHYDNKLDSGLARDTTTQTTTVR